MNQKHDKRKNVDRYLNFIEQQNNQQLETKSIWRQDELVYMMMQQNENLLSKGKNDCWRYDVEAELRLTLQHELRNNQLASGLELIKFEFD